MSSYPEVTKTLLTSSLDFYTDDNAHLYITTSKNLLTRKSPISVFDLTCKNELDTLVGDIFNQNITFIFSNIV